MRVGQASAVWLLALWAVTSASMESSGGVLGEWLRLGKTTPEAESVWKEEFRNHEKLRSILDSVRGPLFVFSTLGRLGNCLSTYATALVHARSAALPNISSTSDRVTLPTVAVTRRVHDMVANVIASRGLTLPVVDITRLSLVVDVVHPEYLRPDGDLYRHIPSAIENGIDFFRRTGKQRIILFVGYPNRLYAFGAHLDLIRRSFQLRNDLRRKARKFLNKVRKSRRTSVTFVGFHIRRGDFADFIRSNNGLTLPEEDFYRKAMQYHRQRLSDLHEPAPIFVVCSDDLPYAKKTLGNFEDVVFSDMDNAEEDLGLLASCQHSIMTVGSFGFWSSLLAGGQVVYAQSPNSTIKPLYVDSRTFGNTGFEQWFGLAMNTSFVGDEVV
ncbi:galactoside alpha-(1,2)-fucosyltransferase 2-like [Oratosquilla oratoria]|uniref:galactoside alpha-(1,2)-fucosyltransferase 2-like n=1 Tax=Oratosquilla oratoria TaxID=337810 RepID=UPI003F76B579